MELKSFKITNFRSINDSGEIDVARITSLLGRNESGKSNLLLALCSLNPVEGFTALNPIKDFPRHRRLEECSDHTPVVTTTWKLTADERKELSNIYPRAKNVAEVVVGRWYSKSRWVSFINLSSQEFDETDVKAKIRKIVPAVKAAASKLDEAPRLALESAAGSFETGIAIVSDRVEWAQKAKAALATLRQALASADTELTEKQDQIVVELEELAECLAGDDDAQQKARNWVISQLPIFIFLDEYPDLNGHQNISEYLNRKSQNLTNDADRNFEKLCKVAGLDPQKLSELLRVRLRMSFNERSFAR